MGEQRVKTVRDSRRMIQKPVKIGPDDLSTDAIALMTKHKTGCLPVVRKGRLEGILTEHDFMRVSDHLLTEQSDDNTARR